MNGANLQRMHRNIIEYLNSEVDQQDKYLEREVEILTEIETTENMTSSKSWKLRHELRDIRDKSAAHEKLLFYLAESSPLLEEYTTLLQTPVVKRGFMSKKRKVVSGTKHRSAGSAGSAGSAERPAGSLRCTPDTENDIVIQRKTEIVRDFLQIARQYCGNFMDVVCVGVGTPTPNNNSVPGTSSREICEECGSSNVTINVSDSMVCCLDCAYEFTMVTDHDTVPVTTNTDDPTRASSRYEAILHFKSSMAKYQGKQQTTIPRSVYRDLHEEFARAGLLAEFAQSMSFTELLEETNPKLTRKTGVMDRLITPETALPVPETAPYNGAYSRITHDHIILFLRQTNHEKHYEDIMLIHWTLTGLSPPNIGHLEAALEQDFQDLMALYHQEYVIKRNPVLEDGKSFKSNYYILYRLLQKHGFRCRRRDFSNMLKTPDREIFYDTVCKDLFGKLGWEFNSDF